jgi:hypothetical protein
VLVGVDDVPAGLGEEAADRRDQARPVRAGEQQARCRVIGDRPIMARRRRKIRFTERGGLAPPCLRS